MRKKHNVIRLMIFFLTVTIISILGDGTVNAETIKEPLVKDISITEIALLPNQGNLDSDLAIERIKLPDYAKSFYDYLVENFQNEKIFEDTKQYEIDITLLESQPFLFISNEELNDLTSIINKNIEIAYRAFLTDYPEVFWLKDDVIRTDAFYKYSESDGEKYVAICYSLTVESCLQEIGLDAKDLQKYIIERDVVAECILEKAKEYDNDVDKVIYFHDYLTRNNDYNSIVSKEPEYILSYPNNFGWCTTALNGLSGDKGPVCEGFAKAFNYLCKNLGIPCITVDGNYKKSSDGKKRIGHAWNLCKINNMWYAVDVTWDDGIQGNDSHKYLLVGSQTVVNNNTFNDSHSSQSVLTQYEPNMSEVEYDAKLLEENNIFMENESNKEESNDKVNDVGQNVVPSQNSEVKPTIIKKKTVGKPKINNSKSSVWCSRKNARFTITLKNKAKYLLEWSYNKKFLKKKKIKFTGKRIKFKTKRKKVIYIRIKRFDKTGKRASKWKTIKWSLVGLG